MKLQKTIDRISIPAAAAILLITLPAQAAVVASYEFTGTDAATRAAATTSASNLTAGSFSLALGTNTNRGFSSAGNIFNRVNATAATSLATAISGNEYVTVTINPDLGFRLNLTSLTVDLGYSLNASTVPLGVGVSLGASVFSSVDGFSAPAVLGTKSFTAADQGTSGILYENLNIDLSGAPYQGLSGPLEFRIYLYDNEDTQTQPIHRIDNFILNGAVVPEPSAALLGALGALVLLRRRR